MNTMTFTFEIGCTCYFSFSGSTREKTERGDKSRFEEKDANEIE